MSDKRLAGQRSPRWAFMERFEVPNLDDPAQTYLTRWRLVQTPWFGIYLHRMDGPDSRWTLHDHPWSFVSFILRGGYTERYSPFPEAGPALDQVRTHAAPAVNHMRTTSAHFIRNLTRTPTWTLMLVGRRKRTWGYWDGSTTRIWTAFDVHPHAAEFDRAMAWRKDHGT